MAIRYQLIHNHDLEITLDVHVRLPDAQHTIVEGKSEFHLLNTRL